VKDASERCRNCGSLAPGRYCAACGQETDIALPSAGRFLREAAGRYIALDGRLWRSLHALLFRPGHLTREYVAGRRRRYVRPARLFVALSIALFAILRIAAGPPVVVETTAPRAANTIGSSAVDVESGSLRVDRDFNVRFDAGAWPALAPVRSRIDAFNRLSREDKLDRLLAGMLRYAPYAAIGLLPVFALLLKVAYAGRAARYPQRPRQYAAHLVFGAHNHAFVFLAAILVVLIPFGPLRAVLSLWMVIYAFASMRAVYGGSWGGALLRGVFVLAAYAVFFGLAIAALLLAAVTL
jgi:hypothetical protein